MKFVKRHPVLSTFLAVTVVFLFFIKTILLNLFQLAAPYYPWEPRWERIIPGNGFVELDIPGKGRQKFAFRPSCSNRPGTNPEFSFFFRKGKVNKLLFLMSGGGACWSGQNCIPGDGSSGLKLDGRVSYIDQIFPTMYGALQFTPAGRYGMLDYKDAENPIKDWHVLWIWSCDGSVYWGSKDHEYEDPFYEGGKHVLRHRGFDNAMSALAYIQKKIPNPEAVLVSGQSAGGYGSVFLFPYIRETYKKARVDLLFDSSAGIVPAKKDGDSHDFLATALPKWNAHKNAPGWIPGIPADMESLSRMSLLEMAGQIGAYYPDSRIGEYTPAWDLGQLYFYYIMFNYEKKDVDWKATIYSQKRFEAIPPEYWCGWHERLLKTRRDFIEKNKNHPYRLYLSPGYHHGIGQKFEVVSAGVPFKKWLTDFTGQKDPGSVFCDGDCNPPEFVKKNARCINGRN